MVNAGESESRGRPSEQDEGTAAGQNDLAAQLSAYARELEPEQDPELMLEKIVRFAVALIPGTEEGSISLVTGRRHINSRHPSGDLPELVDQAQMDTGQGPCLDAAYEHRTVRVSNLATEKRWPEFAARATELGAVSMLSLQLFVENDNLGALNLYSRHADSFDDESEHVGLLFASHAAIAFADAEKVRNLRIAIDHRDLIGQAKGILMERFKIPAHQAFALLARASQDRNRRIYDLAAELTSTGNLDR